jgi:hypothetical protein
MPSRQNPINTIPNNVLNDYLNNVKARREKFTFRYIPGVGNYYIVGDDLVPESEMISMFPLELRFSPENPDKSRIL